MRLLIAAVVAVAAGPVLSQGMESLAKANELGGILGSEEICGLSYNQPAIQAWIDANVPPSDMGFASSLHMQAQGSALMFKRQSASERTAHCAAVTRTAKHYGFIE